MRIHSECLTGDVFGSLRCDCGEQLEIAAAPRSRPGAGVLVYLAQEGTEHGPHADPHGPRPPDRPLLREPDLPKWSAREVQHLQGRVTSDILAGRAPLASQIPGFEPLAFAVPYSDYGQKRTNYGPIPAWESGWLRRAFKVFFVQDHRVYNLPGNQIGQRYGVRASTSTETLHAWLRQALPTRNWVVEAPIRPNRPQLRRRRIGRRSVVLVFKVRDGITLKATRRRAGRRHRVRIKVSAAGRVRDRRLRPGTLYFYRVVAVDAVGRRSATVRLRVRTHRG